MANKKNIPEKKKNSAKPLSNNNEGGLLQAWLLALAIAVVAFIVMSPAIGGFFTNWDDLDYVVNDPLVTSSTIKYKEIFTTPVMGNYHPITMLTLAWNYPTGGFTNDFTPRGYHLENVLFHALNTLLVFFFIFLLTRRNLLMASIVAFFFGVHPMHVESVAWVSERKDVLYVFFFLAGLITYLLYHSSRKPAWYIATIVLFILSCLSKGMAVVFPVTLLLVDYVMGVKWERKIFLEKIPFFLLAIGFGISVYIIQQKSKAIDVVSFNLLQKFVFACYGAVMYVVKFIVPYNLTAVYRYPDLDKNGNIPVWFYLFPFIFLGIAALVYFFLRKDRAVVFGLLFYLVSIALVLQFISVGSVIMAERYSYLAYIGLAFMVAYFVDMIWKGKNEKLAALKYPVAGIIVLGGIIFSIETYARTQVWNNCETLWTDVMEKDPNTFLAYKNRGYYYQSINEDDKALADYNKVLQLNPRYEEAYNNRGNIYNGRKQYDLAIADYNKAIEIDSTYSVLFANRGISYLQQGKFEKAIPDLSKAIKINPNDANSYYNRSHAEAALGKLEAAKADALKAQQLGFQIDPAYLSQLGIN